MGPGILPETTVGKHNPLPTKALSCQKEAISEHGPEALSCPVGQGLFKMDGFKVQLLQQYGFVVDESGCWIGLPAVQIFHL